jgi:DNA polymerase III subunit epsilon
MSYFVFDTETTGFPSRDKSHDDPAQSRIMQIAWLQLDSSFNEIGCFNSLIRIPENCIVSDGAVAAHGISKEFARSYGVDIGDVLSLLNEHMSRADLVVCHNTAFDMQLVDIENACNNVITSVALKQPPFCTMKTLTPICKIPHKNGRKTMFGSPYKWPSLSEAIRFCFNEELTDAHDALADVRATARLFKWLKSPVTSGYSSVQEEARPQGGIKQTTTSSPHTITSSPTIQLETNQVLSQ